MRYFPQLDRGSTIFEVLGVGQLFFSRDKERFEAVFYFRSVKDLKERTWSGFSIHVLLPIDAIRVLIPGSLWQNGIRISAHTYGGHWVDLSSYKITYVDAAHHLPPEEMHKRLLRAKCSRAEFLSHVNYVQFESEFVRTLIPCAELFRHYLCPSRAYANFVLSSEFQSWLPCILKGNGLFMPNGRSKFNENEIYATQLFSLSVDSVVSGVLPYKNLQVTSVSNSLMPFKRNMLLKFNMPLGSRAKLRVTGQTINPSRHDKRQLHSLIVEKIHESARVFFVQNSLQAGAIT